MFLVYENTLYGKRLLINTDHITKVIEDHSNPPRLHIHLDATFSLSEVVVLEGDHIEEFWKDMNGLIFATRQALALEKESR